MILVLAVSGGVDSMVMLDWLSARSSARMVVAHFDHGTRESSRADYEFVEQKATEYGLEFFGGRAELGEGASEEAARTARYEFLWQVADRLRGRWPEEEVRLVTAHHLDDLVESVAINLLRGTGWRGLAALDTPGVWRPFLAAERADGAEPWDKKQILRYAAKHRVSFRQDPTNSSDEYLRNRLRHVMNNFAEKEAIFRLWKQQLFTRRIIDQTVAEIIPEVNKPWEREWFRELAQGKVAQESEGGETGGEAVALELLRAGTLRAGVRATRPQLRNFYEAVLSYAPEKSFNLPGDKLVKLGRNQFWLN